MPHPVGRVLTSLVAIACLRAQKGVGPQVTSHVFGLKKVRWKMRSRPAGVRSRRARLGGISSSDNTQSAEVADGTTEGLGENWRWLTEDAGCEWALRTVDRVCEAIENAAPTEPEVKSKL